MNRKLTVSPYLILPALTLAFGLQLLCPFIPQTQFLFSDRLGYSAMEVGLLVFGLSVTVFLIPLLNLSLEFLIRSNMLRVVSEPVGSYCLYGGLIQ